MLSIEWMVDDDDDVVENAWTSVLLLGRPLFQSSAEAASSDVNHGKLFVITSVGWCLFLWSRAIYYVRVSSCRFFFFLSDRFWCDTIMLIISALSLILLSTYDGIVEMARSAPPYDWQVCSSLRLDGMWWWSSPTRGGRGFCSKWCTLDWASSSSLTVHGPCPWSMSMLMLSFCAHPVATPTIACMFGESLSLVPCTCTSCWTSQGGRCSCQSSDWAPEVTKSHPNKDWVDS